MKAITWDWEKGAFMCGDTVISPLADMQCEFIGMMHDMRISDIVIDDLQSYGVGLNTQRVSLLVPGTFIVRRALEPPYTCAVNHLDKDLCCTPTVWTTCARKSYEGVII